MKKNQTNRADVTMTSSSFTSNNVHHYDPKAETFFKITHITQYWTLSFLVTQVDK